MPKKGNVHGGRNYKKSSHASRTSETSEELQLPKTSEGQFIAKVVGHFGGTQLEIVNSEGKTTRGCIPGTFFRKVWFNKGDFVIAQTCPIKPDERAHMIHKYSDSDVHRLKAEGHISPGFDTRGAARGGGAARDKSDGDDSHADSEKGDAPTVASPAPTTGSDTAAFVFSIDDI